MDNRLLKVKVLKEDGTYGEMDMLFTFSCDELHKDYVAVTDWTHNENGETNIYVYSYVETENEGTKYTIVTDKDELEMATEILEECKAISDNN